MSDPVAAFYEATGILAAAVSSGSVSSAAPSYEYVISRVGGSDPVKQLSADNIPVFFHHFPLLQERALNAQLDLIEDPSLHIRVRAIRGLEVICKHTPSLIPRIADILTQLMQVEDANELHTVLATYTSLFTVDHRASFTALFAQVTNNDDKKIKEKATEFLLIQLQKYWKQISANTVDTAEQTEIATGIKSVLVTADGLSGKDSQFLFEHLLKLKVVREDPKEVAQLLASQAKLDKDFQPTTESAIDGFISAVKGVQAVKKHGVDGSAFLKYFVTKVAPVLDQLPISSRIALVRSVSGIAGSVDSKTARVLLPQVWEITKRYVPVAVGKAEVEERKADETNHALFSVVEALLHLTLQLSAQTVEGARDVLGIFVATGQPSDFAAESKKNDTVQRLTQLQSSVQQWGKSIQPAIQASKKELNEEKEEEKKKPVKQKLSSLNADQRVAGSLKALIAPLLEKTPVLSSTGSVSWKQRTDKNEAKGKKRAATAADGKGKTKGKAGDKQKDGDKSSKKADSKKGKQGAAASISSSSSAQHGKKQQNAEQKESTSTSKKKRKADGTAGQPANTRTSSAAASSSTQSTSRKEAGTAAGSSQKRKRGAGGDANGQDQQQQQQRSKKRKSDAGQHQQQQSQSKKRKGDGGGGGQVPQQQQQQLFQQVAAQAQAAATQAYLNQLQAASQQFYNPLALHQMAAAFGGQQQQPLQGTNRRGGTQQRSGKRISGRQSIGQRNQQSNRNSQGNAGRRQGRGRGRGRS